MRKRIGSVACAVALGLGTLGTAIGANVVTATPAFAAGPVVYSAVPTPIPPNVPSIGFQATQSREFGDQVGLASNGTPLGKARVLMSSWGCEAGAWFSNDCATTPGQTFSVAITFKVYAVDNSGPDPAPGAVLASKTQTFAIPYRPSASVSCTGPDAGKWYSGGTCYNGFASPITFDFTSGPDVLLPTQVIWTVSYNTSTWGPNPIGTGAACFSTPQGCPYDSLNVGTAPTNTVGTDTDPDGAFWNTATAGNYCDGGVGGTNTLRLDTSPGCWAGFTPAGELQLAGPSVPGAPSKVTAKPGNAKATVSWNAPTNNGYSAVNGYVVTPVKAGVPQSPITFNSTATTQVITGLTNTVNYKFVVAAKNAVGTGSGANSNGGVRVGAPGTPLQPTATSPASGSLKVTFKAPAPNGSKITGYTVTCKSSNGGVLGTKNGGKSPVTVSGLTAGKSYKCRVLARNARGDGSASPPSAAHVV